MHGEELYDDSKLAAAYMTPRVPKENQPAERKLASQKQLTSFFRTKQPAHNTPTISCQETQAEGKKQKTGHQNTPESSLLPLQPLLPEGRPSDSQQPVLSQSSAEVEEQSQSIEAPYPGQYADSLDILIKEDTPQPLLTSEPRSPREGNLEAPAQARTADVSVDLAEEQSMRQEPKAQMLQTPTAVHLSKSNVPGVLDIRGKAREHTKSAVASIKGKRESKGQLHIMKSEEVDAHGQKLLDAWERFQEHASDRLQYFEVDVATVMKPEQVIGKAIRVLWPDEDAWFAGSVEGFDTETGQYKVVYSDGEVEKIWLASGLERVRVLLPAGVAAEHPTPVELHDLSHTLLKQSRLHENTEGKLDLQKRLATCSSRLRLHAEDLCKQNKGEGGPIREELPLGTVVWAKAKGYPPWPALVMSKGDAIAHGVKGIRKNHVCVQYFGEFSWSAIKRSDVTEFEAGVRQGMHQVKKRQAFQRSLFEITTYFQEGVLPDEMLPMHNDEGFSSDDEADASFTSASAESLKAENVRISNRLTVNCFGIVEYLHPAFHNEKYIFPRGYRATSHLQSAASGGVPADHICEIQESPNGSGPLFRISCNGVTRESTAGPQQAWTKLNTGSKERFTGQEGLLAFGLKSLRVRQCIQQLPGANRCEQYCCWGEDAVPPKTKLTLTESRMRARFQAEAQQLPESITPILHTSLEGPRCDACGLEIEYEENIMLQCDGPCRNFIHQACAGVRERPRGSWMCQLCKLGCKHLPACALCPVKGGLVGQTTCGRWCHSACVLWTPEAFLTEDSSGSALADVSRVPKARKHLRCSVCRQINGACIQCGGSSTCFTAFHPLCARGSGMVMESQHDEHFCPDDSPVKAKPPKQEGTGDDCPPLKKRRLDGKQNFVEGTALGDGTRLVCYCPKHSKLAQQPQRNPIARDATEFRKEETEPMESAASLLPAEEDSSEGFARAIPFNHRLRRGLRAPEALSAALAKRRYLVACPYRVTELPRLPGKKIPRSVCINAMQNAASTSWGFQSDRKGVQTLSQRFWIMKATESSRVALGKSQIHGWGAITKTAHQKGDLVIEYSGELIRPTVADAREQQLYDKLVGAGTYIFRMNDSTCVDATRSGNLAHMLNHSCQPNCYSRTIEVLNRESKQEEHVVIVAKQHIPALQELTYDYRFSSTEVLPCNCGAENCCGRVNESGVADPSFLWVPRDQLKPLRLQPPQ